MTEETYDCYITDCTHTNPYQADHCMLECHRCVDNGGPTDLVAYAAFHMIMDKKMSFKKLIVVMEAEGWEGIPKGKMSRVVKTALWWMNDKPNLDRIGMSSPSPDSKLKIYAVRERKDLWLRLFRAYWPEGIKPPEPKPECAKIIAPAPAPSIPPVTTHGLLSAAVKRMVDHYLSEHTSMSEYKRRCRMEDINTVLLQNSAKHVKDLDFKTLIYVMLITAPEGESVAHGYLKKYGERRTY